MTGGADIATLWFPSWPPEPFACLSLCTDTALCTKGKVSLPSVQPGFQEVHSCSSLVRFRNSLRQPFIIPTFEAELLPHAERTQTFIRLGNLVSTTMRNSGRHLRRTTLSRPLKDLRSSSTRKAKPDQRTAETALLLLLC